MDLSSEDTNLKYKAVFARDNSSPDVFELIAETSVHHCTVPLTPHFTVQLHATTSVHHCTVTLTPHFTVQLHSTTLKHSISYSISFLHFNHRMMSWMFVVISLMVQELLCRQTDKQTSGQTMSQTDTT